MCNYKGGRMTIKPIEKPKTPRSKKYMAWIRTQICSISGSSWEVIAHHVQVNNPNGVGMKVSDYRTIPLANEEHINLHSLSICEKEYWINNETDPNALTAYYMLKYIKEKLGWFEAHKMLKSMEILIDAYHSEANSKSPQAEDLPSRSPSSLV